MMFTSAWLGHWSQSFDRVLNIKHAPAFSSAHFTYNISPGWDRILGASLNIYIYIYIYIHSIGSLPSGIYHGLLDVVVLEDPAERQAKPGSADVLYVYIYVRIVYIYIYREREGYICMCIYIYIYI